MEKSSVDSGVVTQAIRDAIGVESEPVRIEVEKGHLKRFVEAIEDPNPLWQDEVYARRGRFGTLVAPPSFLRALADARWLEGLTKLDCPLKRVLNGGNEIESYSPIRPGDTITTTNKLTYAAERSGKLGRMLVLTAETTFRNQFDEIVARLLTNVIRY